MHTRNYFLFTHFMLAAIVGSTFLAASMWGKPWSVLGAFLVSALAVLVTALFCYRRWTRGLALVEAVLSGNSDTGIRSSGIPDIDALATRLAKTAEHWESIASKARDQASEFQAMLSMLDLSGRGEASNRQIRSALRNLGNSLQNYLREVHQNAAEMEQVAKTIADSADAQGNAVIKTTAYIEQLCGTIETVSTNAAHARAALENAGLAALEALRNMQELNQGMQRVQTETLNCEKKLKGLCDPTRQISTIVDSISDIAARTNLLALNASIESIRAGEHGRGFAVVAEEVRNLSEQAADATREISNLLESMQLATQESLRGIVREREQVETELRRASSTEETLKKMAGLEGQSRSLEQIDDSSSQQLQLAQDVVAAVEQISTLAKDNRGHAENFAWNIKKLNDIHPELRESIQRLNQGSRPPESTESPVPITLSPAAVTELTTIG